MKSYKEVREDPNADGMECCAQWSLLLSNIPLALIGMALIALGAWSLAERSFVSALQSQNGDLFTGMAVAMIVTGCVLLVLSVFGCVAAFVENRRALFIYYVLVLVIFLLMCVVLLLGIVYRIKVLSYYASQSGQTFPSSD